MRLNPSFLALRRIQESTQSISITSVLMISFKPICISLHVESTEHFDNAPPDPDDDHGKEDIQDDDNSTELLAFLSWQQVPSHPGHLANVLSTSKAKGAKGVKFANKLNAGSPSPPKDEEIVVNGKRYCQIQGHWIFYSVSSHKSCKVGSLVGRGANGGISGEDVCIIEKSEI